MCEAEEITRDAKSNLAFALRILPRERRRDMVVFYAFCRTIDDLADDVGVTPDARARGLDAWADGLVSGFSNPSPLQSEVVEMRDRCEVPNDLLIAIIDGCQMDLEPRRYETWNDLSEYVWRVACAVGLVSIRLFGCKDPAAESYAVALGRALQLTNILRDVAEDFNNGGRIYLPLEDLARFEYSERDLSERVHDERFLAMMEFEADRAEAFFREADECLPATDRRALKPARIMGDVYRRLLAQLRMDGFRVYEKDYHVSKTRKIGILLKHLIAG